MAITNKEGEPITVVGKEPLKLVIEVPEVNEVDENAMGGTELMKYGLFERLDPELLKQFQIIPSRVRELDPDRKKILWLHDLPGDPESQKLQDEEYRKQFDALVFVSHWQKQQYVNFLGVPHSAGIVLQNAIEPIPDHKKSYRKNGKINLIYHTTPHRGLEILIPVFQKLQEQVFKQEKMKVHLDVYSSFNIYGWPQRDEEFKELFKVIKDDPNMTYHGFKPQEEVRKALKKAHVFAYPSIWQETSCLSLIEAMSAGCLCVHSSLAALPETSANWTMQYEFSEDINTHANRFAQQLYDACRLYSDDNLKARLDMQKQYINGFYNWEVRAAQWNAFLTGFLQKDQPQP
jgi:glycosyltransferase involved in cell wall biosynthesis